MHHFRTSLIVAMVSVLISASAEPTPVSQPMELRAVHKFMYQIDDLDEPGAVEQLAKSDYDLVIVDPTSTIKDCEDFNTADMVSRLHAGKPGRIVLAYLNIGEAERYRTYWKKRFKPATKEEKGVPDYILTVDPDGWEDDYPVAFWAGRWRQMIATGKESQLRQVMAAGFDGVCLDWIDGYDDDTVAAEANKQNIDPAKAMVDWIGAIRKTAREINPHALILAQGGADLIDADAQFPDVIDGILFEDTWFTGTANADWGDRAGGDLPNRETDESSTANLLEQYKKYVKAGKPVFTVDYCLKPGNAKTVYAASRAAGFVPLVTQTALSRMTETPP